MILKIRRNKNWWGQEFSAISSQTRKIKIAACPKIREREKKNTKLIFDETLVSLAFPLHLDEFALQ